MSLTADEFTELFAAGLTTEQMAVVVSIIQRHKASDANRKAKQRERMRRHREAKEAGDASETSPKRHSDVTPKEKSRSRAEQAANTVETPTASPTLTLVASTPDEVEEAFAFYNTAAAKVGWKPALKLNQTRRAQLRERLKDAGGLEGWKDALRRAYRAPHLLGDNERGWVAHLDFFLRASSFLKLIEGVYDARTSTGRQGSGRPSAHDTLGAAIAAEFGLGDGDPTGRVVEERDHGGGTILDFEAAGGAFAFARR